MACPGRACCTLLGLLLSLSGCRLHVEGIEIGPPLTLSDYEALQLGVLGRADVLDRLGPPDLVWYTLAEEVFEYRHAAHSGTDLRFLLPSDWLRIPTALGPVEAIMRSLTPEREEPQAFQQENFVVQSTATAVQQLGGLAAVGASETVALHGRQLRTDVLQLILDRSDRRLLAKRFLQVTPQGPRQWTATVFLREGR